MALTSITPWSKTAGAGGIGSTRQQIELTEAHAKAKRGETVDEATVREIVDRDLFAWTSAVVEAFRPK